MRKGLRVATEVALREAVGGAEASEDAYGPNRTARYLFTVDPNGTGATPIEIPGGGNRIVLMVDPNG